MHPPRFLQSHLLILLSVWMGCISSADAAQQIAGYVGADRALTASPAERVGPVQFAAKADTAQPPRGSQERILAEQLVLQDIAMQVYERNGGVVSAVCHGTAGIANLKLANGQHLVPGKCISGYPE